MMMKRTLHVGFYLCMATFARAQTELAGGAVTLSASYTGDALGNLAGGLKTGYRYLGYATMGVGVDVEKAGGWRGGSFYLAGGNTHGGTPSKSLIGDIQVADNIEAGNHTFLQELWYRQQWHALTLTIGLQDLNAAYAVCEGAGDFLNSSFGIPSILSCNFTTPIFPITGLGLNVRYDFSAQWSAQAAIYDGKPIDFDDNPYNLNWKLSRSHGYMLISEGTFRTSEKADLPGEYKAGVHYHTAERCGGFHAIGEQAFWRRGERQADAFVQLAYTPDNKNTNKLYIGAGLNCHGIFSKTGKDKAGVAFASALFRDDERTETAIEVHYKYQLCPQAYVQPDVQCILDPASEAGLKTAWVTTLRFGVEF